MSESIPGVPAETPVTTGQAAPGPVTGTTPLEQAAPATAPAAVLPAAPEVTPTGTTSVFAEAGKETLEAEAPATDAAVEPVAEAEVKEIAPLPLPKYEDFTLPEDVKLEEAQMSAFQAILGETENKIITTPAEAHAAVQEMGQRMLDMYISESKAQAERYAQLQMENWTRVREDWVSKFKADPEIGGNRRDTTIAHIGALVELYGQRVGAEQAQAVRDAMTLTGAGDHPETLRFLSWAASFAVERPRMVAATQPPKAAPASKAARLYRNTIAGAA